MALILPTSDSGRVVHLSRSCFVRSKIGIKLCLKRSMYILVTITPGCRKLSEASLNENIDTERALAAELIGKNSLLFKFNL